MFVQWCIISLIVVFVFLFSESPKKEERVRSNKRDAFVNFENSTSDAWDDGDDDLLQMASVQMSLHNVRSSANAVLEHHSKQINSQSKIAPPGLLKEYYTAAFITGYMCKIMFLNVNFQM